MNIVINNSLNLVSDSLDKKVPVFALYVDNTKAFDCVGHELLSKKN